MTYTKQFDYYSGRQYLILQNKEQLNQLASTSLVPIAQIGDKLALPLQDGSMAILPNTTLKDYGFDTPYRFSIKTAAYHSYVDIYNMDTDQHLFFGASSDDKSTPFSSAYIRNDAYYDKKYYKGHVHFNPYNYDHIDRSTHGVTFAITKEQARAAIEYTNNRIKSWEHKKEYFDMFSLPNLFAKEHPYFVDGFNCNDFANQVLNNIGIDTKSYDYLRFDEVNLRDRNVLYNYIWQNGNINVLKHIANYFLSGGRYHFHNEEVEKLFVMAETGAFKTELEEQFSKLEPAVINELHNSGYSSVLIEAIKLGDMELVDILLHSPDIDLEIRDANNDNIAQIAKDSGRLDILQKIRDVYPPLLYEYNEVTQPPICALEDCINDARYQEYYVPYKQHYHVIEELQYI